MSKSISLLNKAENKLLAAACALLVLGDLSYANPTTEKTSDIIYSKPVVFQNFHDPGRLISANGKEYVFTTRVSLTTTSRLGKKEGSSISPTATRRARNCTTLYRAHRPESKSPDHILLKRSGGNTCRRMGQPWVSLVVIVKNTSFGMR